MQYLFIKHGVLPGSYYSLPEGEKIVIRVLFKDYTDSLQKG